VKDKKLFFAVFFIFLFLNLSFLSAKPQSLRDYFTEITLPRLDYSIVKVYPHDPSSFTQGLVVEGNILYESTGLYGESSVRSIDLLTGKVLRKAALSEEYFAEGITMWGNQLVQLTWKSKVIFFYDKSSLAKLRTLPYPYEGWGITFDGKHFITSDGSSLLRFFRPPDFTEERVIEVRAAGRSISSLNELEYAKGKIYANVWHEDVIVVIDPQSGEVVGWIDGSLLGDPHRKREDVLNGIAYDAEDQTFLITGKRWSSLYRLRLNGW